MRLLLTCLLFCLLTFSVSAELIPNSVYRGTAAVSLSGVKFHSVEAGIEADGSRIVLVLEGYTGSAAAVQFNGRIKPLNKRWQTIQLREIARQGKLPKCIPVSVAVKKAPAGISIRIAGKTLFLRKLKAEELVFQGMQQDQKESLRSIRGKGITFVTVSNTRQRRYLHFYAAKRGGLQAEYFTFKKQQPQPVKLDRWRVRLNLHVDSSYPNDYITYFARARIPGKEAVQLEFDIERHPMSWSGLRRHGSKRSTPLRFTHFEAVQTFQAVQPDGTTLYAWGYRIDRTEQLRIFTKSDPRGRFYIIEQLHGRNRLAGLTDGNGKRIGTIQWGKNYNSMTLYLRGKKPLLLKEKR